MKVAIWLVIVFTLGVFASRFIPFAPSAEKAKAAPENMVEKVDENTLKLSDEAVKNLKLYKVEKHDVPETLSVMGKISVQEDRTSIIASRIAGRIDAVYAASGQIMKPGEPMASVFSPDIVLAREEYLQTIKEAKTSNDPDDKRLLGLSRQKLESMGMSDGDIDRLSPDQKSSNLIVRSPRAGAVIDKKAIIGNLVNPGDPMFTVGDTDSVWFAGDIYPDDVKKVQKGQELIIDPENGDQPIHGNVSFISPIIDPATRTIKVRAQMKNPGASLKLDMYVKGSVILKNEMALTVPKVALVRNADNYLCFKQMPGNIYKRVNVETGPERGTDVIVNKGVDPGDTVVTDGALLLEAALTTTGE